MSCTKLPTTCCWNSKPCSQKPYFKCSVYGHHVRRFTVAIVVSPSSERSHKATNNARALNAECFHVKPHLTPSPNTTTIRCQACSPLFPPLHSSTAVATRGSHMHMLCVGSLSCLNACKHKQHNTHKHTNIHAHKHSSYPAEGFFPLAFEKEQPHIIIP